MAMAVVEGFRGVVAGVVSGEGVFEAEGVEDCERSNGVIREACMFSWLPPTDQ